VVTTKAEEGAAGGGEHAATALLLAAIADPGGHTPTESVQWYCWIASAGLGNKPPVPATVKRPLFLVAHMCKRGCGAVCCPADTRTAAGRGERWGKVGGVGVRKKGMSDQESERADIVSG